MRHIVAQNAAQVLLFDDEQMIEAFLSNTSHPALSKCVGIRRLEGCPHDVDPLRGERCVKRVGEYRVVIVDQEAVSGVCFR